jgi:multisubunit Na+/H+ antiporter MnhB subunit
LKKFVYIFSIIAGLYWIINGLSYGVWVRKGPGGGFLPVLAGSMAILFCLVALWADRKDKSPSAFNWLAFLPAGALLGMVILSYVLGMIISMAIFIFGWLRFIEKHTTKSAVSIGIGTAAVLYLIFVFWLRVPLPLGLFEALL